MTRAFSRHLTIMYIHTFNYVNRWLWFPIGIWLMHSPCNAIYGERYNIMKVDVKRIKIWHIVWGIATISTLYTHVLYVLCALIHWPYQWVSNSNENNKRSCNNEDTLCSCFISSNKLLLQLNLKKTP